MIHTNTQYILSTKKLCFIGLLATLAGGVFVVPQAHAQPVAEVTSAEQADGKDYGGSEYKFLAPISALPGIGDTLDVSGGGFDQYIKAIIDLIIGLIAVFGVIRIVRAGIDVITTDKAEAKTAARKSIAAVIWSFALIVGSWILLNTVDPKLTNAGLILDPIKINVKYTLDEALDKFYANQPGNDTSEMGTQDALDTQVLSTPGWYVMIDKERLPDGTEKQVKKFLGPYTESGVCGDVAKQIAKAYDDKTTDQHADTATFSRNCFEKRTLAQSESESALRKQLAEGGVYVYNKACGAWGQRGCTTIGAATFDYGSEKKSIHALGGSTISFLLDLAAKNGQSAQNCTTGYQAQCAVLITGGTEIWAHSTHKSPDVVDLAYRPALMNYILSHASVQAPSFGGNVRYLVDGYWFTDEKPKTSQHTTGSHFHICSVSNPSWTCRNNPVVGQSGARIGCYDISAMTIDQKRRFNVKVTTPGAKYCDPQIPATAQ